MTDAAPLAPLVRPHARRLVAPLRLEPAGGTTAAPASAVLAPAKPAGEAPSAAHQLAHQVGSVLVEVLQGRRPAGHLETVTDASVYATVEHLARSGLGARLRLRSVRVQVPAAGVVEACLGLVDAQDARSRAAALRLERRGTRWVCQALEIALTSDGVTRARGRA